MYGAATSSRTSPKERDANTRGGVGEGEGGLIPEKKGKRYPYDAIKASFHGDEFSSARVFSIVCSGFCEIYFLHYLRHYLYCRRRVCLCCFLAPYIGMLLESLRKNFARKSEILRWVGL